MLSFFALLLTLFATAWASRAAGRAAKAAERSAVTSEKASELQLRAYVGIDNIRIRRVGASTYLGTVNFKNYGVTPASDAAMWIGTTVADTGQDPYVFRDEHMGRAILGANAVLTATTGPIRLSHDFAQQVRAETKLIYVWGEVKYKDIFKQERYFRFRVHSGSTVHTRDPGSDRDQEELQCLPDPDGYEAN